MNLRFEREPAAFGRIGIAHAKGWNLIREGLLPPPVHVGRAAVWPAHEADTILLATAAGATEDQLRKLVAELVALRDAVQFPTHALLEATVKRTLGKGLTRTQGGAS